MKERLFKKSVRSKKNCQTCLMNTLFNVSLTVKKYKPLIFVSCDISLQACGGWAGSSQNCGCRIFNFPSQLRFPPLFFPNFVDGKIRCLGGRSNVWIKSHGGMSTNQKHQWMISNGWNLGHKTVSNRIPQSASWEKIRASQWFMLNKRNAVMSKKLMWGSWRNDDVTRE